MSIAIYTQMSKLTDVAGRVDYATSASRQEHLLATATTVDDNPEFWRQLAEDCQVAWRRTGGAGQGGKCCEGREVMTQLPDYIRYMPADQLEQLAKEMANDFKEKYAVDCALGIHLNKAESNVHVHIVFSERQRLPEVEIKVADRNIFLDEKGVRKRTKKEILGADGQLRRGCKIVQKGELLYGRRFGEKEEIFKESAWLHDYKEDMAAWINERLNPDEKRYVFDSSGPYIPQVKIGKGRDKKEEEDVRGYNAEVQAYNRMVRHGAIPLDRAKAIKSEVMLAPLRRSALGGCLASELLENPELKRYLSGSPLYYACPEVLERLNRGATCGKRTAVDPNLDQDEAKKQRLRYLYKQARIARQKAKEPGVSLDDKVRYSQEARACSAEIDRLRRELGYETAEDIRRRIRDLEKQLRRKRDWIFKLKRKGNWYSSREKSLQRWIRSMEQELYNLPVFFCTKEQEARKAALERKIEEAKEQVDDIRLEAALNRKKIKEEKKALKEMRKDIKEERDREREKGTELNAQNRNKATSLDR